MDGLTDEQEALIGTNPNSADSDMDGLDDLTEVMVNGGTVTSPADTDGDTFIDALDEDDDNDGQLTRDEDADGDGNPANDDVDGDGVPDYLGMSGGMNVSSDDSDGDGVSNTEEASLGLDPQNADSDGDGICDGASPALGCAVGPDPRDGDVCIPGRACDLAADEPCQFDDSCASRICARGSCVSESETPQNPSNPEELYISLASPNDNEVIKSLNLKVFGTTHLDASVAVWINGEQEAIEIAPRANEIFAFEVVLEPGTNSLGVVVKRGDEELREGRTVIVEAPGVKTTNTTANADGVIQLEQGEDISGTADPGEVVTVEFNGRQVCQTTADDGGNWSCALDGVEGQGQITVLDEGGNVLGTLEAEVISGNSPASSDPEGSGEGGCNTAGANPGSSLGGVLLLLLLGLFGLGRAGRLKVTRFEADQLS